MRSVARKSLVYRHDLPAGHVLTENDLIGKRPGVGVGIDMLEQFIGRPLIKNALTDQLLEPGHVQ